MSAAATLVCAEPAVARIATARGLRAGGGRRRSSTPRPAHVTQCPRNGRRSRGRDQRLPDAAVRGASPHPATFRVLRYPGTRKIGHYGGLGPRAPFLWRRRPDKGQAAHRTALLTLALSSIRGRRLGFAGNFPCRASAPSRSTRRASSRCDRRSRLRRLRWGSDVDEPHHRVSSCAAIWQWNIHYLGSSAKRMPSTTAWVAVDLMCDTDGVLFMGVGLGDTVDGQHLEGIRVDMEGMALTGLG